MSANNILLKYHHGGLKYHSTDTALTNILHTLHTHKDTGKITFILQTDLSSCFDTIDHRIHIDKLNHYGIRDIELEIIKSYLAKRHFFVEVDTFRSDLQQSLDTSIVQGSILSAILYLIYTNEIPLLSKVMKDNQLYNKITDNTKNMTFEANNYNNIIHFILNYIDDSSNIISHNDKDILINYLTEYYIVLEFYYNKNKLLINADKTVLLTSCSNNLRKLANQIQFQAGKFLIKQKSKIKILGYILNNTLTHDSYINNIISKVNYKIYIIDTISKYMSEKTRIITTTAIIYSVIR